MAGIADMLVASTLKSSDEAAPDLGKAMNDGAALGLKIQETQQARMKLEQQKKDLHQTKIKELTDDLLKMEKIEGLGGKALSNYKNFLLNKAKTYGVDDLFNAGTIDLVSSSPENMARFNVLYDDVVNGRMSQEEGIAILNDQSKFYDVRPDMLKSLREAGEKAMEEKGKMARVERQGELGMGKQVQGQRAAPSVELGKDRAKRYETWTSGNGEAAYETYDATLANAIEKLKNKEVEFGTIAKQIPFGSDEAVLARTDQKAKGLIDAIRGGINIRERTGDPNPTAQQIDRILGQIIDPRLSNEENIKKLEAARLSSQKDKESKVREFQAEGFISGGSSAKSGKKEAGKDGEKTYTVGGKPLTAAQAKAFYKANPKFLKDEKLKKELGL